MSDLHKFHDPKMWVVDSTAHVGSSVPGLMVCGMYLDDGTPREPVTVNANTAPVCELCARACRALSRRHQGIAKGYRVVAASAVVQTVMEI